MTEPGTPLHSPSMRDGSTQELSERSKETQHILSLLSKPKESGEIILRLLRVDDCIFSGKSELKFIAFDSILGRNLYSSGQ